MDILDLQAWEKLKKKNEIILLGVSDSQCPTCCQTEGLLFDFQGLNLKHKGKMIPVARIDTSKPTSRAILQKEDINFDSVPRLVIVRDGRFYSYDAPFDRIDLLVHHLNRLINPFVILTSEEEIEEFLGLNLGENEQQEFWQGDYNTTFLRQLKSIGRIPSQDEHWMTQKVKTRAVCFLYDKQEYKSELNELRQNARFLSTRDNLRIGLVDTQRLVKKFKSGRHGPKLFAPISMSSLVLRRYDGSIHIHDITGDDHVPFNQWINKNSLKEVEELNTETYRIQELLRQPMFLTFVDYLNPKTQKASYQAVEVLKEVAPKYSHLVSFFHVNNTIFWQRKRILGVTWDDLPSMAFNFLGDASKILPYPRGREISKKAMFDFFDDVFTGRRSGENNQPLPEEYKVSQDFSKTKNDTEIETILLNNTLQVDRSNFSEVVYQEGYDVLLFLYTTEVINNGQRTVALQVNLVADALSKLRQAYGICQSIRVVSYDVNVNAFPEGIDFTLDIPQLLFVSAYNKRPPFKKYNGGPAIAGPLLLWVQKQADVTFKYPVDVSRLGYPKTEDIPANNAEIADSSNSEENIQEDL